MNADTPHARDGTTPSPMQCRMGADWARLPAVLRRHHQGGAVVETGMLEITIARRARPLVALLGLLGALVRRPGRQVATTVTRRMRDGRQHWHRRLRYADGELADFDSHWDLVDGRHLVEFVDPVLGWELVPAVVDGHLQVRGQRYVARLGGRLWTVPSWLTPGAALIVERAVDDRHYAMDFRLVHPLLGEVFRYAGTFVVDAGDGDAGH